MVMPKTYKISGGDGGSYGPIFGPANAREIAEIDTDGTAYLLLELDDPITHEQGRIDYLVVSPRYVGDSIKKLRRRGVHVGVGRVLPNQARVIREEGVSETTVENWAVGICTPIK